MQTLDENIYIEHRAEQIKKYIVDFFYGIYFFRNTHFILGVKDEYEMYLNNGEITNFIKYLLSNIHSIKNFEKFDNTTLNYYLNKNHIFSKYMLCFLVGEDLKIINETHYNYYKEHLFIDKVLSNIVPFEHRDMYNVHSDYLISKGDDLYSTGDSIIEYIYYLFFYNSNDIVEFIQKILFDSDYYINDLLKIKIITYIFSRTQVEKIDIKKLFNDNINILKLISLNNYSLNKFLIFLQEKCKWDKKGNDLLEILLDYDYLVENGLFDVNIYLNVKINTKKIIEKKDVEIINKHWRDVNINFIEKYSKCFPRKANGRIVVDSGINEKEIMEIMEAHYYMIENIHPVFKPFLINLKIESLIIEDMINRKKQHYLLDCENKNMIFDEEDILLINKFENYIDFDEFYRIALNHNLVNGLFLEWYGNKIKNKIYKISDIDS